MFECPRCGSTSFEVSARVDVTLYGNSETGAENYDIIWENIEYFEAVCSKCGYKLTPQELDELLQSGEW